jgi:hypothetical protein
MAVDGNRPARGPRITVQLDRAQQEFLKTHRREYGVAASWIVRRLIENQMATGRDLLGKPLKTGKQRKIRRVRPSSASSGDRSGDQAAS